MLIVLDTNVLVSALLTPLGKPAQVLEKYFNRELILCLDERILSEYRAVLKRPKFNFPPAAVDTILQYISNHSLKIVAQVIDCSFQDQSDKKFYEVAKTCNATLITGNLKHYPKDTQVKAVDEFLKLGSV